MVLLTPFFGVPWNATDITLVMGATGALLTVLVGLYVKVRELGIRQEKTHGLVNSVAESLKTRAKELADAEATIARLEGEKAGIAKEREKPMIAAIVPDETVLTKEKELTEAKKAELKARAEKPKRRRKAAPAS